MVVFAKAGCAKYKCSDLHVRFRKYMYEMYSPESPPVMGLVPLNSVGGPVKVYDMVTDFLGG